MKSGLYGLKRALSRGGLDVVDGRSEAGRALAASRRDLEAHVGGTPSATQDKAIESLQVFDVLIGTGVEALHRYGAIDRRKRAYRPLALQIERMLVARLKFLEALGWTATPKHALSPSEVVAELVAAREAEAQQTASEPAAPAIEAAAGSSEAEPVTEAQPEEETRAT